MFRQVTVPRWVMWVLTLQALGVIALICFLVLVGLSLMPNYGEQPFSSAQRTYLDDMYPHGVYVNPSTFRVCLGGNFFYIDARQAMFTRNEACASGMPKR